MSKEYFVASKKVAEFHSKVSSFAVFVTCVVGEEYRKSCGNVITNGALYSIASDAIGLHKVIKTLCSNGWAFATPLILRSIQDLFASLLVIVNADNDKTELMAFRYSHWFLKANLNDPTLAKDSRKQIKEGIEKLPKVIQSKAKEFMFKEKMRSYWYAPEYFNAKDVIDTLDVSFKKNDLYDKFSSASHGGLLGLRLFKDVPDDTHPNPRADKRSQNLALIVSIRLMLEIFGTYGLFMKSSTYQTYKDLLEEFNSLRSLVE